jgi:hypothetical protein
VQLVAGGSLFAALGLTLAAPMPVLLWAPLVFGIPHLLGDLWVLGWSAGAPNGALRWVAGPLALMMVLRALAAAGWGAPANADVLAGTAAVLLGAASTRSVARLGAAAALCVPLWVFAAYVPLVLAHLHNVLAVGLVCLWGPRRLGLGLALASALGVAVILGGAADGALAPFGGLEPGSLAATLAPGLSAVWAERSVTAFCFAQLVHYLCWVWLLPTVSGASAGGGALVLGALLLPAVALAADPAQVRAGYLGFVVFHGWFELAMLAAWRR